MSALKKKPCIPSNWKLSYNVLQKESCKSIFHIPNFFVCFFVCLFLLFFAMQTRVYRRQNESATKAKLFWRAKNKLFVVKIRHFGIEANMAPNTKRPQCTVTTIIGASHYFASNERLAISLCKSPSDHFHWKLAPLYGPSERKTRKNPFTPYSAKLPVLTHTRFFWLDGDREQGYTIQCFQSTERVSRYRHKILDIIII